MFTVQHYGFDIEKGPFDSVWEAIQEAKRCGYDASIVRIVPDNNDTHEPIGTWSVFDGFNPDRHIFNHIREVRSGLRSVRNCAEELDWSTNDVQLVAWGEVRL